MTDRGVPIADGSPACPFVAFEDERDQRADRPDHRHRCFAEAEPAPRALAHQEAYCLSSAFPVCPTFQEWARREAAHAVHAAAGGDDAAGPADPAAGAAGVAAAVAAGSAGADPMDIADDDADDLWNQARGEPPLEDRPTRNPRRDWAAPPPWASGAAGADAGPGRQDPGRRKAADSIGTPADDGRGLAGSAADRLARGGDVGKEWGRPASHGPVPDPGTTDSPAAPADPELASLVGRAARQARDVESHGDVAPPSRPVRRPTVSSTRDRGRDRERERERAAEDDERGPRDGPAWERQRRYEAYPTIKTRAGLAGLPGVPTVAVLFGGVVLAAIVLFFLPALLGVGGPDASPGASPTPSVAASTPSPDPTPVPEPTQQTYVIKSGDTLSRIAREFGVTLDALLEANKDRIANPNRIAVGDEIIIPPPQTEEVPGAASASPS